MCHACPSRRVLPACLQYRPTVQQRRGLSPCSHAALLPCSRLRPSPTQHPHPCPPADRGQAQSRGSSAASSSRPVGVGGAWRGSSGGTFHARGAGELGGSWAGRGLRCCWRCRRCCYSSSSSKAAAGQAACASLLARSQALLSSVPAWLQVAEFTNEEQPGVPPLFDEEAQPKEPEKGAVARGWLTKELVEAVAARQQGK